MARDCARRRPRRGRRMKLSHQTIELNPTHPFVIARGGYAQHRNVIVRITDDDGARGLGRSGAEPVLRRDRSRPSSPRSSQFAPVLERADRLVARSDRVAAQPHAARQRRRRRAPSARRCTTRRQAARASGLQAVGTRSGAAPQSSFTIAIAENDGAASASRRSARSIRSSRSSSAPIATRRSCASCASRRRKGAARRRERRVDAQARARMIDFLAEHGVEFVEQPVAGHTTSRGCASCASARRCRSSPTKRASSPTDVARLAGAVDGINIKLAKCGGLREALRMIARRARAGHAGDGGCMIESELGISAAAQIRAAARLRRFRRRGAARQRSLTSARRSRAA